MNIKRHILLDLIFGPTWSAVVLILLILTGCSSIINQARGPAAYLDQVRNDHARLEAFVRDMPKGGDIHTHLSGIIDAESYLQWAATDGMCINTVSWTIGKAPCDTASRPVSAILRDQELAGRAVDAFSMRHFALAPPRYGHDHFFAAFSLFWVPMQDHWADMLAEAATKAAADNTDYLELLHSLEPPSLYAIADAQPWTGDLETWYGAVIGQIRGVAPTAIKRIGENMDQARSMLGCASPIRPAACGVTIRYIHHAIRHMPNHRVFASLILGAELAVGDRRVVGVDLVAPEDNPASLANYRQHMAMLAFLKRKYPSLNINLHAGELSPALVSAQDLTFHITAAVRTAHAQRLGHAVSIGYERGGRRC